jgi:hypothetical protein
MASASKAASEHAQKCLRKIKMGNTIYMYYFSG